MRIMHIMFSLVYFSLVYFLTDIFLSVAYFFGSASLVLVALRCIVCVCWLCSSLFDSWDTPSFTTRRNSKRSISNGSVTVEAVSWLMLPQFSARAL